MIKAHDVQACPRRDKGMTNAGLLWNVCRYLRLIALVLIDIRDGRRALEISAPELKEAP